MPIIYQVTAPARHLAVLLAICTILMRQLLVQSNTIESSQLLVRSYKRSGYARGFVYIPTKACATFTSAESGVKPLIDYTPAPEILNAAYPVRLEQLP